MGTRHWQCPHCGELIRKGPLQDIVEMMQHAGDDILGEIKCSNCGNSTAHANVYGGRHDVTIPREESIRQALPVEPVSKEIRGTKAAESLPPPSEELQLPLSIEPEAEKEAEEPEKPSRIITQKVAKSKIEGRSASTETYHGSLIVYAAFCVVWLLALPFLVFELLPSYRPAADVFQALPDYGQTALGVLFALIFLGIFMWSYRRMRRIDEKRALLVIGIILAVSAAIGIAYLYLKFTGTFM